MLKLILLIRLPHCVCTRAPYAVIYLDDELPVLGFLNVVQHVLDVQRELQFRVGHVVDGGLLGQDLVPNPYALGRASKYVPHLVVELIGHPAPATLELALLKHAYPGRAQEEKTKLKMFKDFKYLRNTIVKINLIAIIH